MRTFFNMLGPMVNPAKPTFQLVGVYNLEMARIYNYLLQQAGKPFTIIHGLDGYDEISLTNDTKVITQVGEHILSPEQLGKRRVLAKDIEGGKYCGRIGQNFQGYFGRSRQLGAKCGCAGQCRHGPAMYG